MMQLPKLNVRALILGFLLLVLALPGLNLLLPVIESGKLLGDVHPAPDTVFTIDGWVEGRYQQQKEAFINDNIGFRPDFVRVNNELDYLLFAKLHAAGVILGEDDYLYESGYINAYNGTDFIGPEMIRKQLTKLRFIQDTLARAGKTVVMAFTPSKGRFYPEHFPKKDQHGPNPNTNYALMLDECARLGIHFIDLNGWFLHMKDTIRYPLFTKQGIHWTHWASGYAVDSFNHYLEKLLKIDIPDIQFHEIECSDVPRQNDDDISQGLNLIWPVTKERFCYNHLTFVEDSPAKTKPAVVFLSDSFFWTWISDGFPNRFYTGWEMWYYFSDFWDQASISGHGEVRHPDNTNWMADLAHKNAVVLFFTEPNLPGALTNGFVDQAYTRFGGK